MVYNKVITQVGKVTMNQKIEFLNTYLPRLRALLLQQTIAEVRIKEETFDNIVTDLDLFVQNQLTRALSEAFPDTAFLSEEDEEHVASPKMWVIDPIDGTKNFYRRQEDFAISVAYYEQSEPVFGFVYDIAKDLLFLGIKGQGSWLNGNKLPALKEKTLNQSVLDMNLKTLYALTDKGANVRKLNHETFAHRSIGSAALSLCRIALGLHDIYLSSHLKFWDYAASRIILEEVGGVVRLPFIEGYPMDDRSVTLCACTSENHYDAIMNTLFKEGHFKQNF